MRLRSVIIGDYKSIEQLELPWASAVVLFGPNDAGKSNILEAVSGALRMVRGDEWTPPRPDRFHPEPDWSLTLRLELDGLAVPGALDELFFCQFLQFGRVWIDSHLRFEEEVSEVFESEEVWPRPFAWSIGQYKFDFGEEALSSSELTTSLHDHWLQGASMLCEDWPAVSTPFAELLEVLLSSRHFFLSPNRVSWWLEIHDPALADRVATLSQFLLERAELFEGGRLPWLHGGEQDTAVCLFGELLTRLAEGKRVGEFLWMAIPWNSRVDLWDVVDLTAADATSELVERVSAFIGRRLGAPGGEDPWIEEGLSGWWRVPPDVASWCDQISEKATALAPEFVRELGYEVLVEPVEPREWVTRGARVQVSLAKGHLLDDRLELRAASSGVAIWAAYSIVEAVRRLEEQARRPQSEPASDPTRPTQSVEEPDDDLPAGVEELLEERQGYVQRHFPAIRPEQRETVYVLDEPERHLHLSAQRQLADWILETLGSGHSSVLVATHAPALLSPPAERAQLLRVYRGPDGNTRIDEMTADLLRVVAEHGPELGVPPTVELDLTRGWLIVEGAHDEAVLSHFFGRELERARVGILPLRGVANALALLDLGVLRSLQKPLFALFDNVRAGWIDGAATPEGLPSREEKIVDQLRRLKDDPEVAFSVVPFPYPDIWCALPEEAIHRTLSDCYRGRSGRFSGWDELLRTYQAEASPPSFKRFMLKQIQLGSSDEDLFLTQVLERSPQEPPEGSTLGRAVNRVLAQLDQSFPPS